LDPSSFVLIDAGAETVGAAGASTFSTFWAGVDIAGGAGEDDEERLKVAPEEN
jgi:hypothetical protein